MKFVADLHFHSKYSRAVSPKMELINIAEWGKKKGIDILTTTDFTHPFWFQEIKRQLKEVRDGVYQLKENPASYFILTTEISLIFPQHRIHLVLLAPNLEMVEKINQTLTKKGFNLLSDGRPILGTSVHGFTAMIKEISDKIGIICAHIWTPWFSLYGSRSGFNSINEAFGKYTPEITAVETGLSSDPLMNWQIEELDSRIIVSFSDSHSLKNLGRETTVFELPKDFIFDDIITALKTPYSKSQGKPHVSFTTEFHPEEGKYHYTGHRKCNICHSPEETQKLGSTCPVCGRPLTLGVMHQVKKLSRKKRVEPVIKEVNGLKIFHHPKNLHHPYIALVPLREIIAEAEGVGDMSKRVQEKYHLAVDRLGGELNILLKTSVSDVQKVLGERVAEGIEKNRKGDISIDPGYDGVYGKVKIWASEKGKTAEQSQMSLL